jgi:hypothetical protein
MKRVFGATLAAVVLASASAASFGNPITAINDAKNDATDVLSGSLTFEPSDLSYDAGTLVSGSYHIYNAPFTDGGLEFLYDLHITFDAVANTASGSLSVKGLTHDVAPDIYEVFHSTDLVEFDLDLLRGSIADSDDSGMDLRHFRVAFNADATSSVPAGTRIVTEAFADIGAADTWVSSSVAVPTPASFAGGLLLLGGLGATTAARRRRLQ